MEDKKELSLKTRFEFAFRIVLIIVIVFLSTIFSIGFARVNNLYSSGVETLNIHIIYSEGSYPERVEASSNKMFDGGVILVKFYNLNYNQTYYITISQVGRIKTFNETEEITIAMAVGNKYFCILSRDFEDIIGIWIMNYYT